MGGLGPKPPVRAWGSGKQRCLLRGVGGNYRAQLPGTTAAFGPERGHLARYLAAETAALRQVVEEGWKTRRRSAGILPAILRPRRPRSDRSSNKAGRLVAGARASCPLSCGRDGRAPTGRRTRLEDSSPEPGHLARYPAAETAALRQVVEQGWKTRRRSAGILPAILRSRRPRSDRSSNKAGRLVAGARASCPLSRGRNGRAPIRRLRGAGMHPLGPGKRPGMWTWRSILIILNSSCYNLVAAMAGVGYD